MAGKAKTKASYVTTGNVFADLGFSNEKATALLFKAKILSAILEEVRRKKYSQKQLTQILDEHQPVVSNLVRGKISQISIEKLLFYADRLGLSLDIRKTRTNARRERAA
ncbi:MAG TPA: helix-turn-helix transcriptional regulator [Terriglobales bacterium]|nr:helix-turn-helix transcriptional regulator [Terriglobales bacterium]